MKVLPVLLVLPLVLSGAFPPTPRNEPNQPNILFVIADDWSWPHAGAYGDPVIQTPNFDRIAREGVLFEHAYVSSPSCTPSRAAILTGQSFWRLGGGGNLYGPLAPDYPVYTDLLEANGYHVGYTRKGWGPGNLGQRTRNPAGPAYESLDTFLDQRPQGKPFCFWFGSYDPHRAYEPGSGAAAGIPLDQIQVPPIFPDNQAVRGDIADYFFEVQRLDHEIGEMLAVLERSGELDHTLVVVTSDNGMPFPRAKSHLYDMGVRVPLAIRWPEQSAGGRTVTDFVSLTDFAPTVLDIAGIAIPDVMTGRSFLNLLTSEASGLVDSSRTAVFFGKERHVPAQEAPDGGGYPMRAIRTADVLYIRNFRPDRWPSGTPHYDKAFLYPAWYSDTDGGPTKHDMVDNRYQDETHRRLFDLAFAKRPAEELYDLQKDPHQLHNVAADPAYTQIKKELWNRLMGTLQATGDPRVRGQGDVFDMQPYTGGIVRARGM
jgi:arylsulfatase A-like enzyme